MNREMNASCSCIIPCFNEAERVGYVIAEMKKVPLISDIVVVDDGSSDGTSEVVAYDHPDVTLARHKRNKGKSEAVRTGMQCAAGDHLFLMDADFEGVGSAGRNQIEAAVRAVMKEKTCDMVILGTKPRYAFYRLTNVITRGFLIIAGQRVLRKEMLQDFFAEVDPGGYCIEYAMNTFIMNNSIDVRWIPFAGLHCNAFAKFNLRGALRKEWRMYSEILPKTGLVEIVKQTLFFCRRRLE